MTNPPPAPVTPVTVITGAALVIGALVANGCVAIVKRTRAGDDS